VAVLSHWVIDSLVHRPDLLLNGDSLKVGLGLWDHLWLSQGLEVLVLVAGLWAYLRATRPINAIVEGCTDAETGPKPPWRERKEHYVAHLESAPPSVRLVSCADKLHNARAIVANLRVMGSDFSGRFSGGRDGAWSGVGGSARRA